MRPFQHPNLQKLIVFAYNLTNHYILLLKTYHIIIYPYDYTLILKAEGETFLPELLLQSVFDNSSSIYFLLSTDQVSP